MSDKDSSSSGEVVEVPGNIKEDEGKWKKFHLKILQILVGKGCDESRTSLKLLGVFKSEHCLAYTV